MDAALEARACANRQSGDRRHGCRRPSVSRLPVRWSHADGGRPEGHRVQLAPRRSGNTGDPATVDEPLLPLLPGARGSLRAGPPDGTDRLAGVVPASRGYPESSESGQPIHGIAEAQALPGVEGPRRDGAARWSTRTAGGRVLTIVGRGPTSATLISRAGVRAPSRFGSTACSFAVTSGACSSLNCELNSECDRRRNVGCRVNQADPLRVRRGASGRRRCGHRQGDADLVVVNSCSVTATADQGRVRRSAASLATIRRRASSSPPLCDAKPGRGPRRCPTSSASSSTTTSRD